MEINLLKKYPKTKRNIEERAQKTEEDRKIAKQFGKEFFDGDRKYGYGGYKYNPKYWEGVVQDMIKHYKITENFRILDIGCAKGFLLYEFIKALPGLTIRGLEISQYAVDNALPAIKPHIVLGNAKDLSRYTIEEFDLIISINTIHNLPLEECKQAIKEIQRVGKRAFITLDAYHTIGEKEKMLKWNLTAETILSVDEWEKVFKNVGYKGDYWWFIP